MNCDGVRGLLSAYVDGELSAGELLRVEQHLRRCHWCADEVDALRQTIALVASLEEVEVPPTFHARLHERLVALGPPVKAVSMAPVHLARRRDFRRWAVPAAAAAALVIGVAGLNRINPPAPANQTAIEMKGQGAVVNQPGPGQETGEIAKSDVGAQSNQPPTENTLEQGGGETQETPTQTAPIENPPVSVNPAHSEEDSKGPALGNTNPRATLHVATPSFLTNIEEPTSLPSQQQRSAVLTATVAEAESLAAALKAHFGDRAVVGRPDPISGVVKVQITVDAERFAEHLAFVEKQTGAKAEETSLDLAPQIKAAYDALTELDRQRAETDKALQGVTDPQQIQAGQASLAELTRQANEARDAYVKLVNLVANGTIEVILKPHGR